MKPRQRAISFGLWALFAAFTTSLSAQKVAIAGFVVEGNERTRTHVILREVPLAVGDSIDWDASEALAADIVRNLTNTSLFNFMDVSFDPPEEGRSICRIRVDERWYVWPGVIFSLAETNFNSWWENKDFERINYGFYIQDYNFRGRREKLTFNFQGGWKRKLGINYQIPGLNRRRTLGAGLEVYYANNREVNHRLDPLNKRGFLKTDRFIQEEFVCNTKLEFRPRFLNTHRINIGYFLVTVQDTVIQENADYLPFGNLRSEYLYLSYGFKRERRDNRAYPLTGYIIDGTIDQRGLGLLRKKDVMLTEVMMTVNTHHALGGRWFFGHGVRGKYTLFGTPSYYFQRGLGYANTYIRGYELWVIDGQHYFLYKSNLKYQLIRKRTIDLRLPYLQKFDKFHYSVFLNLFGDAGYVVDNINTLSNPMANSWQYSAGIGLDIVTYYDVVMRLEGSFNAQGLPGFYINFRNPI